MTQGSTTHPRIVGTVLAGPGTSETVHSATRSLARVCDRVILVWTGTTLATDDAIDSAREGAPRLDVVHWPWRNDFGAARQAALDAATATGAEWSLAIDSDEWLDCHGEDVRATILASDSWAIGLWDQDDVHAQPRAVRLPSAARFSGRTHEALDRLTPSIPKFARARVHTHPKTAAQAMANAARDVEILREEVAANPTVARWKFYLGRALLAIEGCADEGIRWLDECAATDEWDEEAAWACYEAAHALMFGLDRPRDALARAVRGVAAHPGVAENACLAAVASTRLGRPDHAIYWAEMARVHGERPSGPYRALDHRVLPRHAKWLREGPADVEKWALRALGRESEAMDREREIAAWQAGKLTSTSIEPGTAASAEHFEAMHAESLRGMNYGAAADKVETSGERWLLGWVRDRWQSKRTAFPTCTVFDVGANVGDWTEAAVKTIGAVARVKAFEPGPAYAALAARFPSHGQVQCVNVGLSDECATSRPLFTPASGSEMASLTQRRLDHLGIRFDERDWIATVRLDDVCLETPAIDLLKLDVEGHEFAVLRGASRMLAEGRIDVIQFEGGGTWLDARITFRDFWELLSPRFDLFRLCRNGLAPIPRYSEALEVYTTANYVAVRRHP